MISSSHVHSRVGIVGVSGLILSSTVTIAFSEAEFPFSSVAVRVTVLLPILEQSKMLVSKLRFWIPQASFEPLSI